MHKLPFTLALLLCAQLLSGQSPHGKSFRTDCSACHTTTGWRVDRKGMTFNHDTTRFKLVGQHFRVDCRGCHKSLEFAIKKSECRDCHDDLHEGTLGPDCSRCHTPKSWIVENISEIHRQGRFPLTGAHQVADCKACHKSGSLRRFEPLGLDCINCHLATYQATTKPNHQQAGYGTDCIKCHQATAAGWTGANIEHSFFPLTGGHSISCTLCHTGGDFTKLPTDCNSCHQKDYAATLNPNHQQINLPLTCLDCHTTNPGWKPARFTQHDTRFFPVYTGRHANTWNNCSECHKESGNYAVFSCVDCHEHSKARMDDSHKETNGYQYTSVACFTCHPRGDKEGSFNHSQTNFPLTGAHSGKDCLLCHKSGFAAIPTDCNSCHKPDFDKAQAPAHASAGIPSLCEPCHTTVAWKPSTFNHSTTGFELVGGHTRVQQCADCHKGSVVNTLPQCISCHQVQYDNAKEHKSKLYPAECQLCHTSNVWTEITFNHATSKFPLTGAHIGKDCASCHANGYVGISIECNSCHTPAFTSAKNPNHTLAGLPVQCETCHNTTAWRPSGFSHAATGYALTGGHARVAQCSDCHKGTVLNTRTECLACHQVQYDNAKDHKSKSYPVDCRMCHNADNWLNASFNHAATGFPLTGAHTSVVCATCHKTGFNPIPSDCNSCHATKFASAASPNHTAAGIPLLCENCHNTTAWKPGTFNHGSTGFTLTGGHLRVQQCSECHKGTVLTARPECLSCHQVQYDNARNHKTQSYPVDCRMCHNADNWLNASFNHAQTAFPLTGSHIAVQCATCHKNGYGAIPTDCNSCHAAKFASAASPNHATAGIPATCETCHNTTAWKPGTFNHTTTGFALTGGHLRVQQCSDCHKGTVLTARPECLSCHQVQYDNAVNHKAQSYPTDCRMCHNADNWLNAAFNHALTAFPLTGSHTTVQCATCHKNGFGAIPADCNSCHAAKFAAAAAPNHVAAGIPVLCETCHNTTAWKPGTFSHTTTGFALTGGHLRVAQCSSCHKGSVLTARPECISCHQAQYDNARDHKAKSYPTDCKMCHNSDNWLNASFNHALTPFPLTGAHTTVQCATCHKNGYGAIPYDCNSCHAAKFAAAAIPNHVAAGIPVLCETCHNTTAWKPGTFNHTTTGFALTGGHLRVVQCSDCHKGTVLTARPECISCHQAQYDNAKDHKAQSYPTDCKMCHSSDNWLNASFNHSTTVFPLTGAHTTVLCASCHKNGYANTPTACVSCHQEHYNAAVNPNHKSLGLAVTCGDCHTTSPNWQPATFPVHANYYPLTGAHGAIATNCALCHKGNYSTTPNTCFGCHAAKYNATTNPNHATAQFPTNCEACHTVTAWTPSTFNHDTQYFKIYTGKHRGQWTLCSECHTTPTNFSVYNCLNCHEHNKASMDSKHQGRAGYSYTSAACFSCHSRV